MKQDIIQALIGLLGSILIILINHAKKAFVDYMDDSEIGEELKNKQYLVKIAVDAVEQVYKKEDGAKKFELAKEKVIRLAEDNGVEISMSEIDDFIEQAVGAMNKDKEKDNSLPKNIKELD